MRRLREERGLTQAQLAGDRYSVAFVSRIESGERTPSPEALATFAERLGASPADLLAPVEGDALITLEQTLVGTARSLEGGDWAEARRMASHLLELARAHGSVRHEAAAIRALGEVEEYSGDPERAIDLYEQVAALVAGSSVEDRIDAVVRLARTHRRLGDLGRSGDLLERAIADLGADGELHPAEMARLHLHLSATCSERGDMARARMIGLRGVEYAKAAGDRRSLANALWAAAPPMAVADPARALSLIRRAGTLYAELGSMVELARLHAEMGVVALQAGDRSTARTALERAEELMGPAITSSARSTILQTRAELELQEGNTEEAARLAGDVIRLAEGVEPLEQARARRVLGEAMSVHDPEAAERELRAAIELFTSAGAQMDTARCFRSLGELLIAQGRTEEALDVFRSGLGAVEGAA